MSIQAEWGPHHRDEIERRKHQVEDAQFLRQPFERKVVGIGRVIVDHTAVPQRARVDRLVACLPSATFATCLPSSAAAASASTCRGSGLNELMYRGTVGSFYNHLVWTLPGVGGALFLLVGVVIPAISIGWLVGRLHRQHPAAMVFAVVFFVLTLHLPELCRRTSTRSTTHDMSQRSLIEYVR
jgi:hypothetical protein